MCNQCGKCCRNLTDKKSTLWREKLNYNERQEILKEPEKDYCRALKDNKCLVEILFGTDKKPEACQRYICRS